jgi:hypothetical protein
MLLGCSLSSLKTAHFLSISVHVLGNATDESTMPLILHQIFVTIVTTD